MSGIYDKIHHGLSKDEAINILRTPSKQLASQSDAYMAAAHLINFPGEDTKKALVDLLRSKEDSQAKSIAKRKAVEVIGRLGYKDLIDDIGKCLVSKDTYLVENAAIALGDLGCTNEAWIDIIIEMIESGEKSNTRALIQTLSRLKVVRALPAISAHLESEVTSTRGAAASACITLGGEESKRIILEDNLLSPNQMDRQCAIQDIIDANASSLAKRILKTPVSPVFRIRALRKLTSGVTESTTTKELLRDIDSLIVDNPNDVDVVHRYESRPTNDFLVQEFFGTDFSRGYLSMKTLLEADMHSYVDILEKRWYGEADNDYGANYFILRLISLTEKWAEDKVAWLDTIISEAIHNLRPQFSKSRPPAILARRGREWMERLDELVDITDSEKTVGWECRYAGVLVAERLGQVRSTEDILVSATSDKDPWVAKRARLALDER